MAPLPRRALGRIALVGGLHALLLGCGSGADQAIDLPPFQLRDSAGIQIAESSPAAIDALPRLTFASEPDLDIGMVEGPPEYQLDGVSGVVSLSDGTIAVLNRGTYEIRFYSPYGTHLTSVGRQGEGPGEFRSPSLVGVAPGDTLILWDSSLRKIVYLTVEGGVAREIRLAPRRASESPLGRMADGSVIVRAILSTALSPEVGSATQEYRMIRMPPGIDHLRGEEGDTIWGWGIPMEVRPVGGVMSIFSEIFLHNPTADVGSDYVWLAPSDFPELVALDAEGEIRRRIRWGVAPEPVTEEDIIRYREYSISNVPEDRREQTEDRLAQSPYSETFPSTQRVAIGTDGRIWVREYRKPWDQETPWRWIVFEPDGRPVARVTTPLEQYVYEFGPDYLLGREPDELEVHHVRRYRLVEADSRGSGGLD